MREEIAVARKSAGMSEFQLASELEVPAWLVDVVEHGIMNCDGEMITAENLVPESEMEKLTRSLSEVSDHLTLPQETPDEDCDDGFTYYFPVTISSQSLLDELEAILGDAWSALQIRSLEWLMFKYKLYSERMHQLKKEANAEKLKRHLLAMVKKL